MTYAVVQIRGTINTKHEIKNTLKMMHLTRPNHCVIVPENDYYEGMLQKVKDYITWGEVNAATLTKLISSYGKRMGDKPIAEDYLKAHTEYTTLKDFAQAVLEGKVQYGKLEDIKPIFRLCPPLGGHRSTKRPYSVGVGKGALGYRGKAINDLLEKMMHAD